MIAKAIFFFVFSALPLAVNNPSWKAVATAAANGSVLFLELVCVDTKACGAARPASPSELLGWNHLGRGMSSHAADELCGATRPTFSFWNFGRSLVSAFSSCFQAPVLSAAFQAAAKALGEELLKPSMKSDS